MRLMHLLAIGLLAISIEASKQEMKDMARGMMKDCQEQEKASENDLDTILDEKFPTTREGKCLGACLQEQFGVVKDKRFDKEGFMMLAKMAAGEDEAKLKQMEEIADECQPVTDPDRCEQAMKIAHCMEEGAKKRKMSYDFGDE